MKLRGRIDRLLKTAPCPACHSEAARTVIRSLWPGETAAPEPEPDPEPSWCLACGRRTSARVLTVIHEQA